MLLALLSDTHDNVPATLAALRLLAPHKPDLYLHAGDLVSPDMLDHFADLPFHFVFGNNEYDLPALRAKAKALNLTCHDFLWTLTLSGKRLALLHGHKSLPAITPPYDYIITGHTHTRHDQRLPNKTRLINPGALHRTRQKSVALVHLESDTLTFLDVT
jgi:uncharacterized protein